MTPPDQDIRELAFLEGPLRIGPLLLRPLSLMSMFLAELLGLTVVLTGGDRPPSVEELRRQVYLYLFIQTAKPSVILQTVRESTWSAVPSAVQGEDDGLDIPAIILDDLRRQRTIIIATRFKVRGGGKFKSYSPSWLALSVNAVALDRGWSEDWILWHLPFVRVPEYRHATALNRGLRTRPADDSAAADSKAELAKVEQAAALVSAPAEW